MADKNPVLAMNGGEVTPLLWGRSDQNKYRAWMRQLNNFVVEPQGAIKRRLGSVIQSRIGDVDSFVDSIIHPWIISRAEFFQMIFVNSNIIFFNPQGVQVFTLAIPYSATDFDQLYFRQVYDTMYVCHPDYPVQIIKNTSEFVWTIAAAEINGGPYATANGDTSSTVSVVTGIDPAVTITSTEDLFTSDDVGRKFRIAHAGSNSDSDTYTSSDTSDPLPATGTSVTLTTGNTWTGTISLQLSIDGGTSWQTIGSVTSKNNLNNIVVRDVPEYNALVRVDYVDISGTIDWTLEIDGIIYNNYIITGYTSATEVSADLDSGFFEAVTNSWEWALGSFGTRPGYPTCCEIFDERLFFSGVEAYPSDVYVSQTLIWENFQTGFLDTSPFRFTLLDDVRNRARWFAVDQQLIIGTDNAPFTIGSRNSATGISIANILVQKQQQVGTDPVQPIRADNTSYFVESGGKRIRSLNFVFEDDGYASKDMTILAPHLMKDAKIVKIAFVQTPDRIVYVLLDSGLLLTFTTEPDQNVNAWSKHPLVKNTQTEAGKPWEQVEIGTVIDIDSILTTDGDIIGMIVKRQDGIYYESTAQTNECIDALTVFDGITVNDCLALPGNEDFTYWNASFNEKTIPYSGLGSFLRLAAPVDNLIVKYDGVEIVLGDPLGFAQVRAGLLYWLPFALDNTLITVFDLTVPVVGFYTVNADDCMIVKINALSPILTVVINSSGAPLTLNDEYFAMTGDSQYLIIEPGTTDLDDITVDVEFSGETELLNDDEDEILNDDEDEILVDISLPTTALPVDQYSVFFPRQMISTYTDSTNTAYFGLKIYSLAELVDMYNSPQIGGGQGGKRRDNEFDVFVVDSVAFELTANAQEGDKTLWRNGKFLNQEAVTDQKIPEYTGKIKVETVQGYAEEANIGIRSDSPYCLTVSQIGATGVKTDSRSTN